MNSVPKRVATRTGIDPASWPNSEAISGDPLAWVTSERTARDIVVIGSLSLVHALAEADMVDEYRIITFPTIAGQGDRLFTTTTPANFSFTAIEPAGPAALTTLRRERDADRPDREAVPSGVAQPEGQAAGQQRACGP